MLRPHRDLLIPGSGEGRAHSVCEVLLETPPQPGVQGVVWDPTSLPLGPQGSCLAPLSAIAPGDASPHSTQDVQGQFLLLGLPTTFFMSHSQHPVPAPPHRSCQHTPHPTPPPAGAPCWQPLLPCSSSHQHWQGRIPADAESPRHPHRACLPQRHRCSTRSLTGRKRHFSSAKQCANTGSKLQHCPGTETRAVRGFACLAQSWRSNF